MLFLLYVYLWTVIIYKCILLYRRALIYAVYLIEKSIKKKMPIKILSIIISLIKYINH